MKHCSVTRVVAITTLTCLLTVFALPAAAAPFGGVNAEGIWSPASLLHWVQAVWAGWFGLDGESAEPAGIRNVHANLGNALDPDGRQVAVNANDPGAEEPAPQ